MTYLHSYRQRANVTLEIFFTIVGPRLECGIEEKLARGIDMLWLKAFHLISIVCWFAGLFYLPRLFVYHSEASDTISLERFKVMERKLYYGIMLPSMLLTIFFGLALFMQHMAIYKTAGWMHTKLLLVFFLIGYHHICGRYLKQFAENKNKHSSRFYRIFNEVPVVFLIAIIILAVVRPF